MNDLNKEVNNEKDRNSKKGFKVYFDFIKKPLTLLSILVVVLILMVVTPVEYLPVIMSLVKAIVKVLLIGEVGGIDV